MATINCPVSSVYYGYRYGSSVWADIVAGSGSALGGSLSSTNLTYGGYCEFYSGSLYGCWRTFTKFDTTGVAAGDTITGASIFFNVHTLYDGPAVDMYIKEGTYDSYSEAAAYNGFTGPVLCSATRFSTGWVEVPLTSTSFIVKEGYTRTALLNKKDVDVTAPTASNGLWYYCSASSTYPPYMEVYTGAAATGGRLVGASSLLGGSVLCSPGNLIN